MASIPMRPAQDRRWPVVPVPGRDEGARRQPGLGAERRRRDHSRAPPPGGDRVGWSVGAVRLPGADRADGDQDRPDGIGRLRRPDRGRRHDQPTLATDDGPGDGARARAGAEDAERRAASGQRGRDGRQGGLDTGKSAKLRALVALPEEGTAAKAGDKPGDKAGDKAKPDKVIDVPAAVLAKAEPTAASAAASADDKASEQTTGESGKAPVAAAKTASAFAPALDTRDTSAGAGLRQVATPALALLILAGLGYWLARRRRATARERHIRILETATLGPKRSIVVARVGGETLVLGTSEAGITLLRTGAAAAAEVPADIKANESAASDEGAESYAVDVPIETNQPLTEALADIPEPTGAGPGGHGRAGLQAIEGGLASLFGRRKPVRPSLDDAMDGIGGDAGFGDVLEDSLEESGAPPEAGRWHVGAGGLVLR